MVTNDNNSAVERRPNRLLPASQKLGAPTKARTPPSATSSTRRQQSIYKPHTQSKNDQGHKTQRRALEVNGENTDDNYESANEYTSHDTHQRQKLKTPTISTKLTRMSPGKQSATITSARTSTSSTTTVATTSTSTSNTTTTATTAATATLTMAKRPNSMAKRPNFVIERRNSVKPANLARGKQQRASISSCSSNDSYASYGSGYASGSGNSTDHEQKQNVNITDDGTRKNKMASDDGQNDTSSGSVQTLTSTAKVAIESVSLEPEDSDKGSLVSKDRAEMSDTSEDHENEETVVTIVDEDEEEKLSHFQLKRHLSELEQLTDDLANRKIFDSELPDDNRTRSKDGDTNLFSSNSIKSTSSSVISTDSQSNFSSLSSAGEQMPHTTKQQQQLTSQKHQQSPKIKTESPVSSNNQTRADSESRSESITPTVESLVPPKSGSTNVTPTTQFKLLKLQTSQSVDSNKSPIKNPSNSTQVHMSTPIAHKINPSNGLSESISSKQEPYYHNLFQWEQLISKGVSRPLLINDLDFTDLRDEDDCDLLNTSGGSNSGSILPRGRNQAPGEPLHINIPGQLSKNDPDSQDIVDSGTGSGPNSSSPPNRGSVTPASAPPPMPPPPMSPWFNTISGGSRPQSQLLLSPTPSIESSQVNATETFNRDQSPVDSTYSNYSRNSYCVPHTSTPSRELANSSSQFNALQAGSNLRSASSMSSLLFGANGKYGNKRKKTMKLFWKEVREDRSLLSKLTKKKTIWDEIKPVSVDTQRLEYLFESKAKDLSLSRSRNGLDGMNQRKVKITVLDAKRSNAINIGMTKLPPMRTIKSAILKMDSSIMNREGIEKILTTMMPTEEEKSRIIEAQLANPDTPLGTAEQFLLNLASISALEARLKLWAFQLDYAQIEKEVAEPFMDLKQAIDEIERSETFRIILGTLLAIGNFLNSTTAKGFQIDYLEKVPEVKDTVHKHSLLHHLCLFIQERYDFTTDLYSEFSAVNRASKIDYVEVGKNLKKMQQDCKASWDYLKIVAKHDGLANLMNTSGSAVLSNNITSSSSSSSSIQSQNQLGSGGKSCGKLNNLSKLSMITAVIGSSDGATSGASKDQLGDKQMKTKVSDFLTDCAERIMVLMVIHRRVINRFHKLLIYLGCPPHQIKQTQPQQILKIINEFALEYRTKRERVKEMLLKRQQCQNNHHHQHQHNNHGASRWQLSRSRWTGSQQYIDSASNRPCSTASLYANNFPCTTCCLPGNINGHQQNGSGNRASSPSGLSQISNYSDYINDPTGSCCQSRQQSITPIPSRIRNQNNINQHSMSMLDLQNRQQSLARGSVSFDDGRMNKGQSQTGEEDEEDECGQIQRKKNEQLRQLLGVGKSFDGACSDLLKMSHWTSTSTRVLRHPPLSLQARKQRAASIDSTPKEEPERRQSSYYKFSNYNPRCIDDELEQNSDEEILQCLVRTAGARNNGRLSTGSYGNPQRGKLLMHHDLVE